jgi:hypothetical protein
MTQIKIQRENLKFAMCGCDLFTAKPFVVPLLHILVLERYFDVTISLIMYAVSLKELLKDNPIEYAVPPSTDNLLQVNVETAIPTAAWVPPDCLATTRWFSAVTAT